MTDDEPAVLYSREGKVARITLNRPAKRNALSADILRDFNLALDSFEADDVANVAILSGNGKSFCAGFDLSSDSASVQSTVEDPWGDRRRLSAWIALALRIWEGPRPIIGQ